MITLGELNEGDPFKPKLSTGSYKLQPSKSVTYPRNWSCILWLKLNHPPKGVVRGNAMTLCSVHVGCAYVFMDVHMYFHSLCFVLTWYFPSALLVFLS